MDVGGTFTDFYAVNVADGEVRIAKRPSTRDNPGRAVIEGLGELAQAGVPLENVRRLAHGTTVATNAIIQRRGGKVVLVTTAGFRDLLEIGRQIRPHMYDLYHDQPPPLVPRERRLEVAERITSGGRVVRPLGDAAVAEAVAQLGEIEADAAAVCLLFAFQNPEHEARLGAAIRAARPDLRVSLSSEVQPEFREFERCSTTVLNAWLQPVMDEYMASLEAGLAERVPHARIGINQSNGGLMSPARARALPVRTALSGPAAGVVGAIDAGARSGPRDLITLDMGGTSADVLPGPGPRGGTSPSSAPSRAFRSGSRASTSRRWGPGAARSPGSTATACSRSDRRARGPSPAPPATAGAAPNRPSPTPTCCSGDCRRGGCSAGA